MTAFAGDVVLKEDQNFELIFNRLKENSPLKTWSLIVTVLGDLAPAFGAQIDSQHLYRICEAFGVKPEAFRVALHRLRRDDWITAIKKGRARAYQLSERGVAATANAYERIYRAPSEAAPFWQVTMVASDAEPIEGDALRVSPSILISQNTLSDMNDSVGVKIGYADIPVWMRNGCNAQAAASDLAQFHSVLQAVQLPESAAGKLNKRILLLHFWRRLLLRQSDVPEQLLGPDWAGYPARMKLTELLTQLPRVELADLPAVLEG